ncbi:hypothetical protein F511_04377 [Dorcoceras hygrometricum]|uniref:THO1-MOS11 C-terminal domain-containing protein n=1 Tax=Dorcoceras hygrometricum TaxID=472368 RepID=A0A2Z7BKC6_9LAMI|nr:hypothetical protein F511_04377 [Dorcoceras hygrometricum]
MAAATAIEVENPKNLSNRDSDATTKDTSSNIPATSPDPGVDKLMGKIEDVDAKTSDVNGGAAVTDIQKKMKRAERFGMSVKLTEEEKRNTRAERFGTATAVNGSDSSKKSEELKRKARAERFGVAKIASTDEEAKKKARLARFGSISKPDPVEEDKRKARAIRFSKQSSSLSKEKNSEEEAVIAGEAGVGT